MKFSISIICSTRDNVECAGCHKSDKGTVKNNSNYTIPLNIQVMLHCNKKTRICGELLKREEATEETGH